MTLKLFQYSSKILKEFFENASKIINKVSVKTEKLLKNITLLLGLLSAIAIIFDWYPLTMFLSFPFCFLRLGLHIHHLWCNSKP